MADDPGHHDHRAPDLRDAEDWDTHYATSNDGRRLWSGRPNGTLVAEASGLAPGRALEVGCGEGADAIWLAEQGWAVTAVDPSRVALERAEAAALAAGVDVTWVHAGLLAMPDGTGEHDLVSAQYAVLPAAGGDAVAALLGAVAPGGTLVFVHHDVAVARAEDHGGDTADLVMPHDVRAALGDDWVVEVDEVRERPAPPEIARHSHDVVLRARRIR